MGSGEAHCRQRLSDLTDQAEVGEVTPSVAIEEDVLGFDVAMNHAVFMDVLEGASDLGEPTAAQAQCAIREGLHIAFAACWAFGGVGAQPCGQVLRVVP